MTPARTQRQEAFLRDCIVSPDVFDHMVERLRDFAVPYQHALETEAGKRNVSLYLQGLLSHLPRKNAEDIASRGSRGPGGGYETRFTPGGCHIPSPAGRIDGGVVFGQ